jgi:hypothetical protein
MTPTDTPRTYAALVDHMPECSEWSQHYLDLSTFARQIERELAISLENQCKAQAEVERLTEKLTITEDELSDAREWLDERYKATSEADERAEKAEAEVARLRELLGRMFSAGVGRMKVEDWRKLHAEYEQLKKNQK